MNKLFCLLGCVLAVCTIYACQEDPPCPGTTCNSGALNEEDCSCVCPAGFAGTSCGVEWSAKFTGTLMIGDTCINGPSGAVDFNYDVVATRVSPVRITTLNLGNFTDNVVEIDVVAEEELLLDFVDAAGRTWSGAGTATGNRALLEYVVRFPGGVRQDSCRAAIFL